MYTFLTYFLWANISLAVLYTAYCVLLRSQATHHMNRMLLWGLMAISFILPLLPSGMLISFPVSQQFSMWLPDVVVGAQAGATLDASIGGHGFPAWLVLLASLFMVGVAYFTVSSGVMYTSLYKKIRSGKHEHLDSGLTLVRISNLSTPFSWYRYIVVPDDEESRDIEAIITHERAHLLLGHTLDLVLLEILLVFLWCNPVIWLIKRDLQDLHEFEADQYVINQGIDATQYQLLLVTRSTGTQRYALANSLNHSSLKKRIMMMQKNETLSWRKNAWRMLGLLPVVGMMALVISCSKKQEVQQSTQTEQSVVKDTPATVPTSAVSIETVDGKKVIKETEVLSVVETMPEFPGGMKAFMNYLGSNIKYPKSAQKAGVEGRVIVQFVVSKTGEIVKPEVVRSVDAALDAEAIRVISSMPNWKPGEQEGKKVNVKYTVPVSFKLQ